MIDPKLLTPDNGIVEGCVVAYRIDGDTNERVGHARYADHGFSILENQWIGTRNLDTIRPLTGPMAIWNFAPESALACMVYETMVQWVEYLPPEGTTYTGLLIRPWWAKGAK